LLIWKKKTPLPRPKNLLREGGTGCDKIGISQSRGGDQKTPLGDGSLADCPAKEGEGWKKIEKISRTLEAGISKDFFVTKKRPAERKKREKEKKKKTGKQKRYPARGPRIPKTDKSPKKERGYRPCLGRKKKYGGQPNIEGGQLKLGRGWERRSKEGREKKKKSSSRRKKRPCRESQATVKSERSKPRRSTKANTEGQAEKIPSKSRKNQRAAVRK